MTPALKLVDEPLPLITNARFLDIGSQRQVLGGTLDGRTFYSAVIDDADGDTIRTAEGSFRYSRSIQ